MERLRLRTCITGGPRTGKTTHAKSLPLDFGPVRHTDDLIRGDNWSQVSDEIAASWFEPPGPWVIEGVAVPRALRKWLKANALGRPCDLVVLLEQIHVPLTRGQETMRKGLVTVWQEIAPELFARGVTILKDPLP